MLKKKLIAFLAFISLSNCSSNNDINESKENFESAENLYREARLHFDKQEYVLAVDIYNEIEKNYPLSNEAIQSQIMNAFIEYISLNYDEAIFKLNKIIKKYPSYKDIDYVYYMKAVCYYEQINDEELDDDNNVKALENFNQIINRFPNSKYAKDSYQKITLINENVAAKHMNIGLFYLKNKKYLASMNRYKIVVEKYSQTKFTPEALHRLVEIYFKLGMSAEAEKTASVIGYNYPKSKWYKHSYELVAKNNEKKSLLNFFKKKK